MPQDCPWFGIINLNKPSGITSRQAVDRVARLVRPAKAGHAGTLDPLASGVLVVCVGPATRLIEYVQRMPKSYRATFLLGRHSNTEDIAGDVVLLDNPPVPTRAEIEEVARALTGTIQQRPPAFSALKVAGRRAYDLARAGHDVELAARPVTIYALDVIDHEYPSVTLDVVCSSGTYIRSLGRDLAESLGTAAVMSGLARTAIGAFTLADAVDPKGLTAENLSSALRPPLEALADLPMIQLDADEMRRISHGLSIHRQVDIANVPLQSASEFAAVDVAGRLVAILGLKPDGHLGPLRNFAAG